MLVHPEFCESVVDVLQRVQGFLSLSLLPVVCQSLASSSPQLPIGEAWSKATAVGSAPQEQPLLWQPTRQHGTRTSLCH